ncbi:MAG: sodium:solute symporter family protein [Thermoplasmata archaeon]
MNAVALGVFIFYMILVLLIGYHGYRRSRRTAEDFFIAGRRIGPILLFFTFAATNFSAFFFFGFAGAAYKYGFGYYGVMAIGTSLMAITFFLLGRRIWRVGKGLNLITPPELFGKRYGSENLRLVVLVAFVVFTLPYIATQAIGGGIALQYLTEGEIPFEIGAAIVTLVITVYLMLGGMLSDVLTDFMQGVMMLIGGLAGVGFVALALGGFQQANDAVYLLKPELFSLPGGQGYITLQIWISYLILWTFCDPMFPHLFQRFYIAKSESAIRFTMVAYPVITMILFLLPVLIGVWGNLDFPGLVGKAPDNILPMMVQKYAPEWVFGFVMGAGFAALMSTADSQLLVLSSMLTKDVCSRIWKQRATSEKEVMAGRLIILVLALVSLAIALTSFVSIFDMLTRTTFTGLAIMFPAAVAVLYWKKSTAAGCIASIIVGEVTYAVIFVLTSIGALSSNFFFGFLPAIPLVALATAVLIVVSRFTRRPEKEILDSFFVHIENRSSD